MMHIGCVTEEKTSPVVYLAIEEGSRQGSLHDSERESRGSESSLSRGLVKWDGLWKGGYILKRLISRSSLFERDVRVSTTSFNSFVV